MGNFKFGADATCTVGHPLSTAEVQRDDHMTVPGHERRPFKRRLLDDFRYAPGSDRGRVATQYVAKGQKATSRVHPQSPSNPFDFITVCA
jgi:hypothetical protein